MALTTARLRQLFEFEATNPEHSARPTLLLQNTPWNEIKAKLAASLLLCTLEKIIAVYKPSSTRAAYPARIRHPQPQANALVQLCTGMARLHGYLHQISAVETGRCVCGTETVEQFLLCCRKWDKEREQCMQRPGMTTESIGSYAGNGHHRCLDQSIVHG